MCSLFWTGVILVFTGMILLVTSTHKGPMYKSWGGVLLGLGSCILLICLILCIHAYCVMSSSATEDDDDKDNHPSSIHLQQPPNTTTASHSTNAASTLANGRKPRSVVQLIPPPKYGLNITKTGPAHTVHFFLSEPNATDEPTAAEIVRNIDETLEFDQHTKHSKTSTSDATTSSGGNVSPTVHQLSEEKESAAKEKNISLKYDNDDDPIDDVRVNSRSVVASSDCDSLMSVETIVPRNLQKTAPRKMSSYDVPEFQTNNEKSSLDDYEFMMRNSGRKKMDFTSNAMKSNDPSKKPQHSTFQNEHFSSFLTASQESLDHKESCSRHSPRLMEEDTMVGTTERRKTGASAADRWKAEEHQPVSWSITRTFGPSNVTVTPLTLDSTRKHDHRSNPDHQFSSSSFGDEYKEHSFIRSMERTQKFYHSPAANQNKKQTINVPMSSAYVPNPSARAPLPSARVSMPERSNRPNPYVPSNVNVASIDRYMTMPTNELEIMESKATVYDNVQYFHM